MKREISILINKSEITAGTRGSSLGPEAIMAAARKSSNDYFSKYSISYVDEFNFMLDHEVINPYCKRIDTFFKVIESVSGKVRDIVLEGGFPMVISADHGSAAGTIAGIKSSNPDKRLGVVWIDAHADLHTPYTTPSGNMHGMPLAIALNEDNKEESINSLSDKAKCVWDELKSVGYDGVKIKPEDLVFVGVRDTEKQEDALINRLNIKNHSVFNIREKGIDFILNEINNQLNECDMIYVSFDVDSMDPERVSYGTGTPVSGGLRVEEAEFILSGLVKNEKVVCIEFVEVNPCLDNKKNKMAEVTFDLLKQTTLKLSED